MEASFKSADELAAIMGAIFTVGGLMVALVAFVTQSNAEQVINKAVTSAREQSTRDIDERIQTSLRGYTMFLQAQEAYKAENRSYRLLEAKAYILNAKAIAPNLFGLDLWLGRTYFEEAKRAFLIERRFKETPSSSFYDLESRPLAVEAAGLLESAILKGDIEDKAFTAFIMAQTYAMMGAAPQKIATELERASGIREILKLEEREALVLLSTCRRLSEAQKILDAYQTSALSREAVTNYLIPKDPDTGVRRFVAFALNPMALQHPPFNPTVVTFRGKDDWKECFLEWDGQDLFEGQICRGGLIRFSEPVPGQAPANPPWQPTEAVLELAFAQFLFIMPGETTFWPWPR
jgi:hypothetical protein